MRRRELIDSNRLSVVIADESWVWRTAVESLLSTDSTVHSVRAVSSIERAISLSERLRPDIFLAGLEPGRSARDISGIPHHPLGSTTVVVLSSSPSEWTQLHSRRLGAVALVRKADIDTPDSLISLVRGLRQGRITLHNYLAAGGLDSPRTRALSSVSANDRVMIACFLRGLGTIDVAAQMSVSPQTVRNRTTEIGRKLGVSGRGAIVAEAIRLGLVADAWPASDPRPLRRR